MPSRKKHTVTASASRPPGKPRIRNKEGLFRSPSPLERASSPPRPGHNPELKGIFKHKEWVSGDPLSTKVERARKQIDQGAYQRPKRNAELVDRKVGYGAKIATDRGYDKALMAAARRQVGSKDREDWERRNPGMNWEAYRRDPTRVEVDQWSDQELMEARGWKADKSPDLDNDGNIINRWGPMSSGAQQPR